MSKLRRWEKTIIRDSGYDLFEISTRMPATDKQTLADSLLRIYEEHHERANTMGKDTTP